MFPVEKICFLRLAVIIIALSGCVHNATGAEPVITHGVQAAPDIHNARQPDGYTFELKLIGDEWRHWYQTTDGYVVIFNNINRTWYYAICKQGKLLPGSIAVGKTISADWPRANQLLSGNCKP